MCPSHSAMALGRGWLGGWWWETRLDKHLGCNWHADDKASGRSKAGKDTPMGGTGRGASAWGRAGLQAET